MNKATHNSFLICGEPVIKNTDFHRKFHQLLDDIFYRNSFMVFLQLLVVVDLAKQDAFHSHIGFNYEWVAEAGVLHMIFNLLKRPVMHNVNSKWIRSGR